MRQQGEWIVLDRMAGERLFMQSPLKIWKRYFRLRGSHCKDSEEEIACLFTEPKKAHITRTECIMGTK